MDIPLKKIVIVGGGAGGLELVTQLCKKLNNEEVKITLVDCNRSHLWKPLLHEVAGGSLDECINALSYLEHAHNYHFKFQLGSMIDINRKNKKIIISPLYSEKGSILIPEQQLEYDILVISLGSISNDFNTPGVREYCMFLDNQYQARRFHREFFNLLLKHSNESNMNKTINIAIVGGGATGVELSAELHNTVKQLHLCGYKELNCNMLNIMLIEASERILPMLPLRISNIIYNKLTKIGICILTKTMINSVDHSGLHTNKGGYIKADLMVWVAGIKAPDFMKNINGLETNNINQLVVESTLKTTRDSNIFAIGDCASCALPEGGVVPPRAQAAHQMASLVLYNIIAHLKGAPLKTYIYKDRGSLVSLSRYSTVGILMNNLISSSLIVKGCIARFIYISLYRMHQVMVYGLFKTCLIILANNINRIIRPRIKLH